MFSSDVYLSVRTLLSIVCNTKLERIFSTSAYSCQAYKYSHKKNNLASTGASKSLHIVYKDIYLLECRMSANPNEPTKLNTKAQSMKYAVRNTNYIKMDRWNSQIPHDIARNLPR